MNRSERRERERLGVVVLRAVEVCWRCGAPICPRCGCECVECGCCSEFNCEGCGAVVERPLVSMC